jgi:esterase/lipase superfamily enzyme
MDKPPVASDAPSSAATPNPPSLTPQPNAEPIAIEPDSVASTKRYCKVSVYYATDRAAIQIPIVLGLSAMVWFRLTAAAAGLTMLLAILSRRHKGRRWVAVASAAGLMITIGLGLMTIHVRKTPDPEELAQLRRYSNQRGALETGVCQVSIPICQEEDPAERSSWLHFEWSQNPLKHVVVLSTQRQEDDEFHAALQDRVAHSARKEAFVFIHGYNVSFEAAARRTAQIAYDLQFDGAPILYSWPSQGGLLGYTVDETNVVWTVPHLKQFLVDVSRRSGAESIHLIAHSMGNRALTSALRELCYELDAACPKFHEVVLTAPDVDADVFRDLAPAVLKTARRVTLYASSNDEALQLSKRVHGYARAGESGAQLVVVPGMDTIDVSAVDTSFLGHSYYGNNRTVLADLFELLGPEKPPAERKALRVARLGQLPYWVFVR